MGVYRWTVTLAHHMAAPVLCTTDYELRSEYKKNEFTGTLVIISLVMHSAVTVVLLTNYRHTGMQYCL